VRQRAEAATQGAAAGAVLGVWMELLWDRGERRERGLDAIRKEFFQNKYQFTAVVTLKPLQTTLTAVVTLKPLQRIAVVTVYEALYVSLNVITIHQIVIRFMNRCNDYRIVIRFTNRCNDY
jgi:hypothetical protein